jgi:hypothetical protein
MRRPPERVGARQRPTLASGSGVGHARAACGIIQSGFTLGFESYRAEWFDSTASTMMGPVMVMRHPDPRAALTDEVARFQAEIRRLALAAAQEILRQELDRRLARLAAPARRRALLAQIEPVAPRPPAREPPREAAPPAEPVVREPAATPPAAHGPGNGRVEGRGEARGEGRSEVRGEGKKRSSWTREAIIEELASWMASGTAIDAAFVARHGPPGLVAATRRIFGRFDAALNVAGLHFSKLYPDGPPSRGTP